MRRLINVLEVIFNLIADFLYAPLFRAHLREVALKVSFLPGQTWLRPGLGRVRIMGATDYNLNYRLLDADEDDSMYTVSRKEFYLNCRSLEDSTSDSQPSGKIIPLNFPRNNQ